MAHKWAPHKDIETLTAALGSHTLTRNVNLSK